MYLVRDRLADSYRLRVRRLHARELHPSARPDRSLIFGGRRSGFAKEWIIRADASGRIDRIDVAGRRGDHRVRAHLLDGRRRRGRPGPPRGVRSERATSPSATGTTSSCRSSAARRLVCRDRPRRLDRDRLAPPTSRKPAQGRERLRLSFPEPRRMIRKAAVRAWLATAATPPSPSSPPSPPSPPTPACTASASRSPPPSSPASSSSAWTTRRSSSSPRSSATCSPRASASRSSPS